jgi:hypothetical protein
LLILAHLPLPEGILFGTLTQVALIYAIATVLDAAQRLRERRSRDDSFADARPLAA